MNSPQTSTPRIASLIEQRARFVSFVRKHIHSAEDAEDIVQSAFLRSVEKLDSVRDHESVVAWFYRVLRNAIIDHYRRTASDEKKAQTLALEFTEEVAPPELRNEVCECILPVVADLKPEYREALTVVDIEERSLRELAKAGSISENNAAVRVHRARQALRKQVQVTCGACATHGCLDCTCQKPPSAHANN